MTKKCLYEKAKARTEAMTYDAHDLDEVKKIAAEKPGFIRAMWCGDPACEEKMKDEAGVSSRCMPLVQSGTVGKCVCCGKEATTDIFWGVAY